MASETFINFQQQNPHLDLKEVSDNAFLAYGLTHPQVDVATSALSSFVRSKTISQNLGDELYIPSCSDLESLSEASWVRSNLYGQMDCHIGYYIGRAYQLNALEFHKCNEILYILDDSVLLLGHAKDLYLNTYHVSKLEAFFVPANTCVELYSSTLHFAPLAVHSTGMRQVVIQQRFTNTPFSSSFPKPEPKLQLDQLLLERNKWVIAHLDASALVKLGAYVGLIGSNVTIQCVE